MEKDVAITDREKHLFHNVSLPYFPLFYFNERLEFSKKKIMKDQKVNQCRFIFTATLAHNIYQGCQY